MSGNAPSGMTRITLSFLLSLLSDNFPGDSNPALTKHHWSYRGPEGPDNWPLHYKHCAGVRQSPIDIRPATSVFDPDLGQFHLENFNSLSQATGPTLLNITNNGHAASVRVTSNMRVSGGGLNGTYRTAEFHFHWGSTDDVGSEHALAGRKFPLEMHVVNYAEKYGNIQDAMTRPDGLAVLGVFFQLSDQDNPEFAALDDALRFVHKAGEHNLVESLRLRYLLPQDVSRYWRYLGSLTTPFCFESVIWTVFLEPQKISRRQLDTLRSLLHEDNHDKAMQGMNRPNPSRLVDNWRPLQPLNGRTVFRSFHDLRLAPPGGHHNTVSHAASVQEMRNIQMQTHNTEVVAITNDQLRQDKGSNKNPGPAQPSPSRSDTALPSSHSPQPQHHSGSASTTSQKVTITTRLSGVSDAGGQATANQTLTGSGSTGVANGNVNASRSPSPPHGGKVGMTISSYHPKQGAVFTHPQPNGVSQGLQSPTARQGFQGRALPKLSDQPGSVFDKLELSLNPNGSAISQPPAMRTKPLPGASLLQQQQQQQQQMLQRVGMGINLGADTTGNRGSLATGSRVPQGTKAIPGTRYVFNKGLAFTQAGRMLPNQQQPKQILYQQQQQQQRQQQLPQQRIIKQNTEANSQQAIPQRSYQPILQQLALQRQQQQQQQLQQLKPNQRPLTYIYKQQPQNRLKNNVQILRQLRQNSNQASSHHRFQQQQQQQQQQQPTQYLYQSPPQRADSRSSASPQQIRSILEKLAATKRVTSGINAVPRTLTSAAARIQPGKTGSNSVQGAGSLTNRAPLTIIRDANGRVIATRSQTSAQPQPDTQRSAAGLIGPSGLRQANAFPAVRGLATTKQRPGLTGSRRSLGQASSQPSRALTPRAYGSSQTQGQGNKAQGSRAVFLSQSGAQKFGTAVGGAKKTGADNIPYVFLHRLQQPVRIRRPYYEKLYNLHGLPDLLTSSSFSSSSPRRQLATQQLLSLHPANGEFNEFR